MALAKSPGPVLKPVQRRDGNKRGGEESGKPAFLTSIGVTCHEVQKLFGARTTWFSRCARRTRWLLFADKLKLIVPHDLMCIYLIGSIGHHVLVPEYVNGSSSFSSLRIPIGQGLSGGLSRITSRL